MRLAGPDGNPWATPTPLPHGTAVPGAGERWYRGNLHCHTTNSDGRLTPQETVDWFGANGYDFLAVTDHNTVTDPALLDSGRLCLIPSTELTASGGELGSQYHLISLGVRPGLALPATTERAADTAAWLREQGAVVFIAHPHWSALTVSDLRAVPAHGIEIYNGGTVLDSQKGDAVTYWDEGLARGERWWGIAVDDTHWHTLDRGLGWVMVRAPEQRPAALLDALAHGRFYASTGPQINSVQVGDDGHGNAIVEVQTSPCAAIYLLSTGAGNQFVVDQEAATRGETGATITEAHFTVKRIGAGGYLRVQCVDWQWRRAWSNPLYLVP